jgi:hypothetical protein
MFDQSAMTTRIFNQLDTNADEKIDTTEMQTLTESSDSLAIDQIMSGLDTNGDGTINKSEITSALKSLGDEIQSRFSNAGMPPPDPAGLFKNADTNSDGGIDKSEFAAIGPGETDDETLDEMFSSIDTDNSGTIDETENDEALSKMGPPPLKGMPPPPPPEEETTSADETDASSVNALAAASSKSNSILQILEALKSTDDTESDDPAVNSIKRLIEELQNGVTYSNQGNLGASISSTKSLFSIIA